MFDRHTRKVAGNVALMQVVCCVIGVRNSHFWHMQLQCNQHIRNTNDVLLTICYNYRDITGTTFKGR